MSANNGHPIPPITSLLTFLLSRLALLTGFLVFLKYSYFYLATFIFFLIILIEGSRLWSALGLKNLTARRLLVPQRLFPGEETQLHVEVENKKRLPVLLSWNQPLPPRLITPVTHENGLILRFFAGQVFLSSWAKSIHTHRFRVAKRGYYQLPPLRLISRDGFGLFYKETFRDDNSEVIVYPALVALPSLDLTPADLIGDRPDRRPFIPDPTLVVGLKDYTPATPARFIHWKASAHQDKLMAKVVEPTANLRLYLVIDVEYFLQPAPAAAQFEEALSAAASLVMWSDSQRVPLGLLSNSCQQGKESPISVSVSSSPTQARTVLECLARARLESWGPLDDLLRKEGARLPWGTTLVVIGGKPSTYPPAVRKVVYYPLNCHKPAPDGTYPETPKTSGTEVNTR